MYTPKLFEENDLQKIADLVRDYRSGLVISSRIDVSRGAVSADAPTSDAAPIASPLPFFFVTDSDQLVLRSHMAKTNPHREQLASVEECLVIF